MSFTDLASNPSGLSLEDSMELNLEDYVADAPGRTKTLRLEFPIIVEGKSTERGEYSDEITDLTFRRPCAKDLDILENTRLAAYAMSRQFIAALTDLAIQKIDKLDSDDQHRAMAVAFGFLPKPRSRPPGETTPPT